MTIATVALLILVFTMFFSTGVQVYLHLEAYPLFAYVGRAELPKYLTEYERRLTAPLLVPSAFTLISAVVLLVIRPASLSVGWLIVALVCTLAVHIVTGALATPVYNRLKQRETDTASALSQLLRINLLRLGFSLVGSIAVIILLSQLIAM
jgi:hypothetical protein